MEQQVLDAQDNIMTLVKELFEDFGQVGGLNSFSYMLGINPTYVVNGLLRRQSKAQCASGRFKNGIAFNGSSELLQSLYEKMNGEKTYAKITKTYIRSLVDYAQIFRVQKGLDAPMVVYRGCNSLEEDGMNGLVFTSESEKFANLMDRGTVLKIHLPKGTKVIKTQAIDSKFGNEVIVPPSDYEIISDEIIDTNNPDNKSGKTRYVELVAKPREFLRDVSFALENMPEDYFKDYPTPKNHKDFEDNFQNFTNFQICDILTNIADREGLPKFYFGVEGESGFLRNTGKRHKTTDFLKTYEALEEFGSLETSPKLDDGEISVAEFIDYIKNSKHFEILKEYMQTTDHHKYYSSPNDTFHTLRHIDNSTLFAYYIASKCDLNEVGIRLALETTRYHDCGRTGQTSTKSHGDVGAEIYMNEIGKSLPLFERKIVGSLIAAHDKHNMQLDDTYQAYFPNILVFMKPELNLLARIVRDADVLDHVKAGIRGMSVTEDMLLFSEARELIYVSSILNDKDALSNLNGKKNDLV